MKISLYQVDASTDCLFRGSPAAVCLLPHWLSDETLLSITYENNLPATAFLVETMTSYEIRWFSPTEIPLCGHGTLAAAYVIFNILKPSLQAVSLYSASGMLDVTFDNDLITLNFPIKSSTAVPIHPLLTAGLGIAPEAVFQHQQERCIVVLNSQRGVEQINPDLHTLKQYDCRGIVVTAPGENVDFVSRTFYPHKIICEDPVTGISHCMLAPYWSKRLGKNSLTAYQASARGGYLDCVIQND